MSKQPRRMIPIYTTHGDVGAYLLYPYLYNREGEWIGWVSADRDVYSVHGHFVGYINDDPRILRKMSTAYAEERRKPPAVPQPILIPATVPLAPFMPELTAGTFDVLEEAPDLLPPLDYGDLRDDLD